MLPETHPLIEAVTEPLAANAERRLAARAFLGEKFDAAHPGVAEATARLEAAGRRKFPFLRKALLWVLVIAALAMIIPSKPSTFRFVRMVTNDNTIKMYDPMVKSALSEDLTEEERLLLGCREELENLGRKRRLHLLVPDNPAYFAEYAESSVARTRSLPPDFMESAALIAPDNAYFLLFAAGRICIHCIEWKKSTSPSGPEWEYDIMNPAVFEEALALIEKAAALPGFESYSNPMIAARVRLLPTKTIAELTRASMYAYVGSSGMSEFQYVGYLLSARAEQLSKAGRKEEFLALVEQRDAVVTHLGRNPDLNLYGESVHLGLASKTARDFQFASDRLGLTELVETYRMQSAALMVYEDRLAIRRHMEDDPLWVARHASLTHSRIPSLAREVLSPPPFSSADLESRRRAEHEFLGGYGIRAIALFLPFTALLVFLFRFVSAPTIRLPAKRMTGVLGMTDWAWVIGLGIVSPIAFLLFVTRLTPLGGREYGVTYFQMAFPCVQIAALLLALLIAPAIAVRLRLGKQLACFGFGDRFTVPLALAVLAMLAVWSLAALPFVERFGTGRHIVLAALAAPPALCLCLLFANSLRSILGKPAARLAQCTTAIAVLPAYPIAIILLCALTPIYSAGEKRWLAKETLLRIDPDAADLGAYEFKVAAQKRKEINAITGVK
jgi:hypothetical protein